MSVILNRRNLFLCQFTRAKISRFFYYKRQNFSDNERSAIKRWSKWKVGPQNIPTRVDIVKFSKGSDSSCDAIELLCKEKNEFSLNIPLVWLRDHCRHPKHYNNETYQRQSDCTNLFHNARLQSRDSIVFDQTSQILNIDWNDGHKSTFHMRDLIRWTIGEDQNHTDSLVKRVLWNGNTLRKVPSLQSQNFGFSDFARLLLQYGVICIKNVDSSDENATHRLSESIAPIMNTWFGGFWTFGNEQSEISSNSLEHQDTAYSNETIGPHTDGTYFNESPGIQVFHCLMPASHGGETVLVDGFSAAKLLRESHPQYFDILSTIPIEHHYLEGIHSELSVRDQSKCSVYARCRTKPVICLSSDNEIEQIRYNPYDRAPMPLLSGNLTVEFYKAYETLSKIINEKSQGIEIKLQPGTVIFIDNFRVLHSRKSFRGTRRMCGCYLSRDGFLAKARPYFVQSNNA